ncbi:acid protease [Laetiporus sulphureus 93-53]|uniref:Acid protease n=1 Tax=Laetiporus sulphureus 93-53 TaxID=1314785 RepID=A0A165I5C7_9APHY|nr:acid protease [Laetiporus sulphureus 93-53]KZT12610.1 acid protease [Laetiporus sulphureus 93-53]
MFKSLAASVVLAVVSASFVGAFTKVSLEPVKNRTGAYMHGAPDAERARAALMKSRAKGEAATIPATNLAYVQYTALIGVGSPPTYYNLVVDTGSSNTFVGTGKTYVRTSTSIPTGQEVNVTYGSGFFSGYEYLDQVTIALGFVIKNQSIGDALEYADFEGVDGIIGVGPVDLTLDTLYPDVNAEILTVMNNAYEQGLISKQILGVSFAPADSYSDTNGALTFGGIDSSLYTGKITYTPVTTTYPSNYYWGINVTRATYGDAAVIPYSDAGIVDTGTTLIYIADDFYSTYQNAIPGAYYDDNTGLIVIPESSVASMQDFDFEIGGTTFTLDAEAQLLPRDQNVAWGAEPGLQYGYIGPIGSPSGEGLDFIIGQKFMERYYAIFDTDNEVVGFAYTDHTYS